MSNPDETTPDERDPNHYAAEHEPLREVHEGIHDGLAEADPSDQAGKPLLLTGFIGVILLALVVLLVVGLVVL